MEYPKSQEAGDYQINCNNEIEKSRKNKNKNSGNN